VARGVLQVDADVAAGRTCAVVVDGIPVAVQTDQITLNDVVRRDRVSHGPYNINAVTVRAAGDDIAGTGSSAANLLLAGETAEVIHEDPREHVAQATGAILRDADEVALHGVTRHVLREIGEFDARGEVARYHVARRRGSLDIRDHPAGRNTDSVAVGI